MDSPTARDVSPATSPTATVVATAISPTATVVATAISPRREPWGEMANTNRSPGRGGSESGPGFPSCGNHCRPYRGLDGVFGLDGADLKSHRGLKTHGSRRGLIAVAPTGAGNRQAGELEHLIASNVAKLLEAPT